MNKLLFILLFFSLSSIAQKPNCGLYGTMKPEERMKQFPFNKAKRITFVTYPAAVSGLKAGSEEPTYIKTLNIDWGDAEHYGVAPINIRLLKKRKLQARMWMI